MPKTLGVFLFGLFLAPSVSWALPFLCTTEKTLGKVEDSDFMTITPTPWGIKETPDGIRAKLLSKYGEPYTLPCKIKKHPRTGKDTYVCNEIRYDSPDEGTTVHHTFIADMTTRKFHVHLWANERITISYGTCTKF